LKSLFCMLQLQYYNYLYLRLNEYPTNWFTNPNPVYKSLIHVTVYLFFFFN
jgi:hypothetical protein